MLLIVSLFLCTLVLEESRRYVQQCVGIPFQHFCRCIFVPYMLHYNLIVHKVVL